MSLIIPEIYKYYTKLVIKSPHFNKIEKRKMVQSSKSSCKTKVVVQPIFEPLLIGVAASLTKNAFTSHQPAKIPH